MRRYQTSIKPLMQARTHFQLRNGQYPIFLSDWDADYNSVYIPSLSNNVSCADLHKYYFWTDEENIRVHIQTFFKSQFDHTLPVDSFTIGSNGTSSIMLSLMALKESGRHRALIITPMYFSTLNLLDELEFDVVEFDLSVKNNFAVDINAIENMIKATKTDIFIVTNPLFGSGIELEIETIKNISFLCNKYNVCFLMDYIYGGLAWSVKDPVDHIFNYSVYAAVSLAEQHIFIESISKRVFLNGVKFALIFSSENIMRRILRLSVFTVGSMAAHQVRLVPQIYSIESLPILAKLISNNAAKAYEHYKIIRTILSDTNFILSNANCGHFVLMSIPKTENIDDVTYAISILHKTGVLTTPHSRYLLVEDGLYTFRVNLLLDKSSLIDGIIKIKDLE